MMGEYIKYKGETVKIGTVESMYYTSYQKYFAALMAGLLSTDAGGTSPVTYAKPDSGFLFRFPFPDEDHIPIGGPNDYDRGIRIKVDGLAVNNEPAVPGVNDTVETDIIMQKLVHRQEDNKLCLALVVRDSSDRYNMFRIEDDATVKKIVNGIIKYHISGEHDPAKKNFYRKLAARVLAGYKLNIQQQQLLQIGEAKPILKMEYKNLPATKNKKMGRRHR